MTFLAIIRGGDFSSTDVKTLKSARWFYLELAMADHTILTDFFGLHRPIHRPFEVE
jgi:hypothetical protein